MPVTTTGKNRMVGAHGVTHVGVFTGNPSSGGTQVGTRQTITFGAASNGEASATTQPSFAVGAGVTVNHVGYYDAATAGNLVAYAAVTSETFGSAGTYKLTSAKLTLTD